MTFLHDDYAVRLNAEIKKRLINDYPDYYAKYYQYLMPFTKEGQDFTIDKEGLVFSNKEEEQDFIQFQVTLFAIKNSFR
jgi:hypothetical protein